MLKISILMYDTILHNDTGVNSKVPLAYLPPEGGGLRSGAVHDSFAGWKAPGGGHPGLT